MKGLAPLCVLCALLTSCGSSQTGIGGAPAPSHAVELAGWRAVPDAPGIGDLVPDLSGLSLTRRVDSPALVRRGDVVRATALTFETQEDAGLALERATELSFASRLEKAFRGRIVRRTATPQRAGFRLNVPRPAEPGRDTVELYFLHRGRKLTLLELVSKAGFDPVLRNSIFALVSR